MVYMYVLIFMRARTHKHTSARTHVRTCGAHCLPTFVHRSLRRRWRLLALMDWAPTKLATSCSNARAVLCTSGTQTCFFEPMCVRRSWSHTWTRWNWYVDAWSCRRMLCDLFTWTHTCVSLNHDECEYVYVGLAVCFGYQMNQNSWTVDKASMGFSTFELGAMWGSCHVFWHKPTGCLTRPFSWY